jgi:MerR family transcriptional regulator, thiopeptide resistance regulator
MKRTYRVNELAKLARVSVRTLHHYDEIGLLVPQARSSSGYRLYDDDAVLRLQQILIGRELGLALEAIRCSLDDPGFDRKRALLEQRAALERRAGETARMIRAIDRALEAITTEPTEEANMDLEEIFDGFDPSQYEEEAKQRWGHTDAYKESARRTKSYTKEDWSKLKDEQAAIYADAFAAREADKSPDDAAVMDIAERHRLSIDRWFYPCGREMHCRLADLYESDSRFAANIDKFGAGLTAFLAAAIRANAQRGEP